MSVAERLGVPVEHIEQVSLLSAHVLPMPDALFSEVFRLVAEASKGAQGYAAFGSQESVPAPVDHSLREAQILLAAALLSQAQQTAEGRLSGALSLMAPLVARANPMKTLGPEGAALRSELLPAGWKAMSTNWEKLRYAWREGMEHLLDVGPEDSATVQALNEITRLHPAEKEPVSVAIQESFPAPKIAFAVTVIGMFFTMRTVVREVNGRRR
jgi:hypothetical protein